MSAIPTNNGAAIDTTKTPVDIVTKPGDGLSPPPKINEHVNQVLTIYHGVRTKGDEYDSMEFTIKVDGEDELKEVVTTGKYLMKAYDTMKANGNLPFRARLVQENRAFLFTNPN